MHLQETINDIRQALAKPCTAFEVGGFRPSGDKTESWLGRVSLCRRDQVGPVYDKYGQPLWPLAQFYLPDLPYVPEQIRHLIYLTVFVGAEWPERHGAPVDNGEGWLIREYTTKDQLALYEAQQETLFKAFPLKPLLKERDMPLWDGGGIPSLIEDKILDLEEQFGLDYFEDIHRDDEHCYSHKFGGYPSFCQSGICDGDRDLDMSGEGHQFVFQIASDSKVGINVIDGGCLMFARHPKTGEWCLYYDFY